MKYLIFACLFIFSISCSHHRHSHDEELVNLEVKKYMRTPSSENKQNTDSFKFIVFGDTPYEFPASKYGRERTFELPLVRDVFPNLVNLSSTGEIVHVFAMHVGDLKGGSGRCTNGLLKRNFDLIKNVYPGRTIFTPGDNDWTDCDRGKNNKDSELERLGHLREIISNEQMSTKFLNQADYRSQPEMNENKKWKHNDVHFFSLHLVGTNNGRRIGSIKNDDIDVALNAIELRDRNNFRWLRKNFREAKEGNASAVIIFTHADIFKVLGGDKKLKACSSDMTIKCDAHAEIRKEILKLSRSFKRPVLFVHGDTSQYCLDRPDRRNKLFWRLNAPGDFDVMDMAEVTAQPKNLQRPFLVSGMLVRREAPQKCIYSKKKAKKKRLKKRR